MECVPADPEPAAKRRRKGQLMSKVKELARRLTGISPASSFSVFHVLHRDVDGRVPLREIASLVAGRRLAGDLLKRAREPAGRARREVGRRQGGRRGGALRLRRLLARLARVVGALALARGRLPGRAAPARRGRKRANTDDAAAAAGDRAPADVGDSAE